MAHVAKNENNSCLGCKTAHPEQKRLEFSTVNVFVHGTSRKFPLMFCMYSHVTSSFLTQKYIHILTTLDHTLPTYQMRQSKANQGVMPG